MTKLNTSGGGPTKNGTMSLLSRSVNAVKIGAMPSSLLRRVARNSHIDWSEFDSDIYCANNYRDLRSDDRQLAELVGTFFADAAEQAGPDRTSRWRAVDVGTGSNLYPAFSMLPFCGSLDLREYSASNVAWLRTQVDQGFDRTWDVFWDTFGVIDAYRDYRNAHDVRMDFQAKANIECASVFDLPARKWDLGTMFFVACSLSARRSEFRRAVRAFVRALTPGAPFAMAFMTNSTGYRVGSTWFPAVAVDLAQITTELQPIAQRLTVTPIASSMPHRPKVGMALATGFVQRP